MGENSKIEWTDHTFNPWMGCTKVSPACQNCYAERDMDKRLNKVAWGPNGTRVVTSDANWSKPIQWNKEAAKKGIRYRVFCASLADVFEDWRGPMIRHDGCTLWVCPSCNSWFDAALVEIQTTAPSCSNCSWVACNPLTMQDVRNRLFALIDATPHLDWLLLTKRPENGLRMTPFSMNGIEAGADGSQFRKNVWLGTSVENQEYANKRIPELLKLRDLSPVLFLSCEPLLGPVNLQGLRIGAEFNKTGLPWFDALDGTAFSSDDVGHGNPSIDWVISGGESGPNARPMHPDWARSLRDQCQSSGVPFHFKQWGEWHPWASDGSHAGQTGQWINVEGKGFLKTDSLMQPGYQLMARVGKSNAGRLLDGREWNEFPVLAKAGD